MRHDARHEAEIDQQLVHDDEADPGVPVSERAHVVDALVQAGDFEQLPIAQICKPSPLRTCQFIAQRRHAGVEFIECLTESVLDDPGIDGPIGIKDLKTQELAV